MRGYFGVAAFHPKTTHNVGTMWRSANIFGAAFIAIIGARYQRQASDTMHTPRHVPLYEYPAFDDFYANIPHGCQLIGAEITPKARNVVDFIHPERAVYLFGPEDGSLPPSVIERCHHIVRIPGDFCLNLAVAGSVMMYDRIAKNERFAQERAA